jgi:DNA replication licensing factor MCM4
MGNGGPGAAEQEEDDDPNDIVL